MRKYLACSIFIGFSFVLGALSHAQSETTGKAKNSADKEANKEANEKAHEKADEKADEKAEKKADEEANADEKSDEKTEEEWLAIGDGFADEKKYTDALLAYKNAYEPIVGRFRGREFKKPVEPRFMTRPELQEYMLGEIKREIKPAEMRFMDRSLKVFGYAPSELDIEETMLKLYTEEVAGFYNPRTKEMFLIREASKKGSITGLFKKLVGFKEFKKDEQKTTLAHEMTHALADQYYDLQSMSDAAGKNDDMALAVSALIEGEATLLMLGEMLSENRNEEAVWEIRTNQVEATFGFAAGAAMVFGGRTMRNAPPIFRKTLLFLPQGDRVCRPSRAKFRLVWYRSGFYRSPAVDGTDSTP